MMQEGLTIYNTLTRKKEIFTPLNPPFVGMYVCGPTVYSDAHLGHARPAVVFDLLYRYLLHLGYRVRYVRNITDVGHLQDEEADAGEDKIIRQARLEKLEPMEVVQKYMNTYHRNMSQLNVLPPSIEPRATGHIIEQQEFIKKLIASGFAYEVNGSVYFDVLKYSKQYNYGKLSGRVLDELLHESRNLEGQEDKKNPYDFALWKKAEAGHLMKWPSPWSEGFPGWHLECSTMSIKYLGEEFDIHGGGMDLIFPHHECEIAQSTAAMGKDSVRYWIHNNMITINGQKMARSLGNFITLDEIFSGSHKLLDRAYSPMTIRFFVLQAHYRSTMDFSNEALQSAEKGLERLMKAAGTLEKLEPAPKSSVNISLIRDKCYEALNDDLNSPVLLSHLFDAVKIINSAKDGTEKLATDDISELKELFRVFVNNILGLYDESAGKGNEKLINDLMKLILDIRQEVREKKEFRMSDMIRSRLAELGITVRDLRTGAEWEID